MSTLYIVPSADWNSGIGNLATHVLVELASIEADIMIENVPIYSG